MWSIFIIISISISLSPYYAYMINICATEEFNSNNKNTMCSLCFWSESQEINEASITNSKLFKTYLSVLKFCCLNIDYSCGVTLWITACNLFSMVTCKKNEQMRIEPIGGLNRLNSKVRRGFAGPNASAFAVCGLSHWQCTSPGSFDWSLVVKAFFVYVASN